MITTDLAIKSKIAQYLNCGVNTITHVDLGADDKQLYIRKRDGSVITLDKQVLATKLEPGEWLMKASGINCIAFLVQATQSRWDIYSFGIKIGSLVTDLDDNVFHGYLRGKIPTDLQILSLTFERIRYGNRKLTNEQREFAGVVRK